MERRKLEKLNIETSILGFGCMRFPLNVDGTIDRVKSALMLERAREGGVNYYDTAYVYHNEESEKFLGEFLKRWQRDTYYVATKLPIWAFDTLERAEEIFEEQCSRLGTNYIDFYLLHAMDKSRYEKCLKLGIFEMCERLKAQGRIKYFGFSFHDEYEVFETMIKNHKWDFCQIQYNYMDKLHQAGERGYNLATEHGIPVVIMEPIRGGSLATLPDEFMQPLKALRPNDAPAAWALNWVATHPNVKVILSGMSTMEQVEQNINTFSPFKALNSEEMQTIGELEQKLRARRHNTCTGCAYCMPCPAGVDIPRNFTIWNTHGIYQSDANAKNQWKDMGEDKQCKNCISCGACEIVCPQQIDIRGDLAKLQVKLDAL